MDDHRDVLRELLSAADELKKRAHEHFARDPSGDLQEGHEWSYSLLPRDAECRQLRTDVMRWFNAVNQITVQTSLIGSRELLESCMRAAEHALVLRDYLGDGKSLDAQTAERVIGESIEEAIGVLDTVPCFEPLAQVISAPAYRANTAFILMWMDKNKPDLEDICNAIKDACASFGITAVRADDIEHQEKITDVVLQRIRESEFLIADLSGERPNVYYELGYSHALSKRPILLRREGTNLHFDVAGYNVVEYKNVTELKHILTKRLEAMTGRERQGGS